MEPKHYWQLLTTKELRDCCRQKPEAVAASTKAGMALSAHSDPNDDSLVDQDPGPRDEGKASRGGAYALSWWLKGPKRLFSPSEAAIESVYALGRRYLEENGTGVDWGRLPRLGQPTRCEDIPYGIMVEWPRPWVAVFSPQRDDYLEGEYFPQVFAPMRPTTWARSRAIPFDETADIVDFYAVIQWGTNVALRFAPMAYWSKANRRDVEASLSDADCWLDLNKLSPAFYPHAAPVAELSPADAEEAYRLASLETALLKAGKLEALEKLRKQEVPVSFERDPRQLFLLPEQGTKQDIVTLNLLCALADHHEIELPPARSRQERKRQSRNPQRHIQRIELSDDAMYSWTTKRTREVDDRKRDRFFQAAEAQRHHSGTHASPEIHPRKDHTWKPLILPHNLREGEEILEEVEKTLPSGETQVYYRVERSRKGCPAVGGMVHDNKVKVRSGPDDIGGE
jgi:hypothetical protein